MPLLIKVAIGLLSFIGIIGILAYLFQSFLRQMDVKYGDGHLISYGFYRYTPRTYSPHPPKCSSCDKTGYLYMLPDDYYGLASSSDLFCKKCADAHISAQI